MIRDRDHRPSRKPSPIENPQEFAAALVDWFRREGKPYPWRQTRDPYAILVSEVMLQQTRVATVLDRGYYARWMERFPTLSVLAEAQEPEVLRAWEGLGYYRRARMLHRLAKVCVDQWHGQMPVRLEDIAALPGVGRYTAGAVFSFARDQPAPIVDGNVARVFSRLMDYRGPVDSSQGQAAMWRWAETLVPAKDASDYNSGLMELGQTLCGKSQPRCSACPVRSFCQSEKPELLPIRLPRRETVRLEEHASWCVRDGAILLAQEDGTRRRGLWKLPLRDEGTFHPANLIYAAQYTITHHRVTLCVYDSSRELIDPGETESWWPLSKLPAIPMSAPFRKAVNHLLSQRKS